MTKEESFIAGISQVTAFLTLNRIPLLAIRADETIPGCGDYDGKGTLRVAVRKCASEGKAGAAWSYPGYVIDRTPYGVVAHETGHYLVQVLGLDPGQLIQETGEEAITSYAPEPEEWLAEMLRLFITNPDLLAKIRAKTFVRLREKLIPVETRGWQEVLAAAPARTRQQAQKKIDSGFRPVRILFKRDAAGEFYYQNKVSPDSRNVSLK
jgi:hypothetical protein